MPLLFLIHNLSAFGFLLVFLPLGVFLLTKESPGGEKKKIFARTVVFGLLVFLFGIGFFLPFVDTFLNHYFLTGKDSIFLPFQPPAIFEENWVLKPLLGLVDRRIFPLSVLGFVIFFLKYSKEKSKEFIVILWWFAGLLLLALQRLIGLNWEPDRFAMMAFQPQVVFAAFAVYYFPVWPPIRHLLIRGAVLRIFFALCLFVFLLVRVPNLGENAAFGSPIFTDQKERKVAERLRENLTQHDVVLINGIRFYWLRYFLFGKNIIWGEYYLICGNEALSGYYDKNNVLTAQIFSGKLNEKRTQETLLKIKAGGNFNKLYLLTSDQDKCGSAKQFKEFSFLEAIDEEEGYHVYRF